MLRPEVTAIMDVIGTGEIVDFAQVEAFDYAEETVNLLINSDMLTLVSTDLS